MYGDQKCAQVHMAYLQRHAYPVKRRTCGKIHPHGQKHTEKYAEVYQFDLEWPVFVLKDGIYGKQCDEQGVQGHQDKSKTVCSGDFPAVCFKLRNAINTDFKVLAAKSCFGKGKYEQCKEQ